MNSISVAPGVGAGRAFRRLVAWWLHLDALMRRRSKARIVADTATRALVVERSDARRRKESHAPPRRPDFMEDAAMAREIYRL